jgi:hypothetical protein
MSNGLNRSLECSLAREFHVSTPPVPPRAVTLIPDMGVRIVRVSPNYLACLRAQVLLPRLLVVSDDDNVAS